MPRLTNNDYLFQRQRLRSDWFDHDARAFSRIRSDQQLDLHVYFAPTKHLYDDELIARRKKISSEQPSLPQRAGRAYKQIEKWMTYDVPSPVVRSDKRTNHRGGTVIAHAVRRPDVDTQKLARTLWGLAAHELKKSKKP